MEFELTAVQQQRYDTILSASSDQLGRESNGPDGYFTRQRWKTAAALGLTGLCLPADQGGGGQSALDTALSLEAFQRGCPDTGLVFAVSAHLLACGVPIRDFASDEVRDPWLSGMADGSLIASNAMTEDDAGSDVGKLAVTARYDNGEYILDGDKSFASNAPVADLIVTYAVTNQKAGFLGLTAFAIPRHLAGVHVGEPFQKMGLTSCPAARVSFRGCRVPAVYRLGDEGQGGLIFQHSMGWERACLFASYVGLMERQLERCISHARHRKQFGRAIGDFQAVSHRIAVMKQRLESARLLLYRGCWLMDRGRDHVSAVALAKVAVSEAAVANSLDAVQIFGGAGYLSPTGVEQQLRDSVPSTLFSGTNEIQRDIIARELGL
ncbi:acyl-CoA dehydrogenase family protein [Streptomyces sp. N2-109]|uniref:Acyl-CoA dehydrogenase family protein n=1 Tax=Streptomyces gossypii TaxID=2883101 RepID=A0ABT2K370_9ACTN|nr:acyl-CoA dehydrogenase family protein [Streptomyces gossypii]MCT2594593.1 acyl-CoA dehydrogenase family protein [Streptomyces gossypii]